MAEQGWQVRWRQIQGGLAGKVWGHDGAVQGMGGQGMVDRNIQQASCHAAQGARAGAVSGDMNLNAAGV